jgi:ubiquinol-cytochrome c reductase iron-sulfur subunit
VSLLARVVAFLAIWRRALRGKRADALAPPEPDPTQRTVPANRRAETLAAFLLIATAVLAVAFVVFYVVADDTQLLGLTGGLALACLAAACILAGLAIVPQETKVEARPQLEHLEDHQPIIETVGSALDGVSRRRLLRGAGGAAGVALTAAVAAPIASIGPRVEKRLDQSRWRRGLLLVDEEDKPIRADDLVDGAFITAFPEGADKRELGSPVVVVRIPPEELRMPPARRDWAPQGILAFSKICTHAGCAISLFRYPLYGPTAHRPALVCPCHYSTFDPARAAKVIFGPAGRALPQLPLVVDPAGELRAGGPMSGPVGPAWWGTPT